MKYKHDYRFPVKGKKTAIYLNAFKTLPLYNWNLELIQHYVRDVTGNEFAVYNDSTVVFWNVYGIDNAGRINYSDNSWDFYLKDHLGTPK